MSRRPEADAYIALALSLISIPARGQNVTPPEAKLANIVGTVTDINGDPVPNAEVVLQRRGQDDRVTIVTPENGYFEFRILKPGIPYQISVRAKGFEDWTSPAITPGSGEFKVHCGSRGLDSAMASNATQRLLGPKVLCPDKPLH